MGITSSNRARGNDGLAMGFQGKRRILEIDMRGISSTGVRIFLRNAVIHLLTVEDKELSVRPKRLRRKLHVHRRVRGILLNPLVIVLPLVAVMWLGWNHYLDASRDLDTSTHNILPGGSFDGVGPKGLPIGWRLEHQGQLDSTVTQRKGYVDNSSLSLTVSHYRSGDLELVSPKVRLQPKTKYLLKGFYTASVNFDLLVRYFYIDGTSQLQLVQSYQSTSGMWSTFSTGFTSGKNIRAVQVVYRFSMNGWLQLDETYIEPNSGIYLASQLVDGNNLLSNVAFATPDSNKPEGWVSYQHGSNHATFSYAHQGKQASLQVSVSNYKDGEAKWQPEPLFTSPGQYFRYSFAYKSTAPADVVAEYVLKNGKRVFDTAETLAPASGWTTVTTQFETPTNAINMFPSIVLHTNGTLTTRNYSLVNITKDGARQWRRPLVSLTFDDGHESQYQNAAALLRRYHMVGTFYVNPATVDTSDFMTTSQLKTLQSRGEELASQGYDPINMTTVNPSRMNVELQDSRNYLRRTFGVSALDFATSYGNDDPQLQVYARKYYQSQRTTIDGINTRQNLDPYLLKVFYVSKNTSPITIQEEINQTRSYNGWLILVYHQVGASSPTHSNADIGSVAFKKQLQVIEQSNISVKTVAGALREVEAQ